MKVVTIADVHGRDMWKRIIDKEAPDTVIFLGDYCDSFDVTWAKQLGNLMDIEAYKRANPNTTKLLLGNHDWPYCGGDNNVSGYQGDYAHHFEIVFRDLFRDKLVQMCYTMDNYLFIHAGLTKAWCKTYDITAPEQLNTLMYEGSKPFDFQQPAVKYLYSPYGDNVWQSPTWVRPMSLKQGAVDGWTQVVGHTQQKKLTKEDAFGNYFYFCDTQETSGEYLVFIDGVPEVHTL